MTLFCEGEETLYKHSIAYELERARNCNGEITHLENQEKRFTSIDKRQLRLLFIREFSDVHLNKQHGM